MFLFCRRLLFARSQYEGQPEKYEWFNRMIRKSLFSIYTRLSGFEMPPPEYLYLKNIYTYLNYQ